MIPRNRIDTNGITSRNKGKEMLLVFVDILLLVLSPSVLSTIMTQTAVSSEWGKTIWVSTGNAESRWRNLYSPESPLEISGSAGQDVEQRRTDAWIHGDVNTCKCETNRKLITLKNNTKGFHWSEIRISVFAFHLAYCQLPIMEQFSVTLALRRVQFSP